MALPKRNAQGYPWRAGRGYGYDETKVKRYKAPRPAPAFKYTAGTAAERKVYEQLDQAWRAGVISSYYFGRRSPKDPTIVWEIDGIEIAYATIPGHLAARLEDCGVVDLAWGPFWCGYRALVVTFANGTRVTQEYDGLSVVERVESVA